MSPEDIELIDWIDHKTYDGWYGADEFSNVPAMIRSIGWVLVENDDCLTLIQSGSSDDVYNNAITIVKSCITSRKKLNGEAADRE